MATRQDRTSRSTARLAAVQALYQRDMAGTPVAQLLSEFHAFRLGEPVEEDAEDLAAPDAAFFTDIVSGADARAREIDGLIAANLAQGWEPDRLDRPMRAILRAGVYELVARADVPVAAIITEYLDVTGAFYDRREVGFVNGLLDAVAKQVRPPA